MVNMGVVHAAKKPIAPRAAIRANGCIFSSPRHEPREQNVLRRWQTADALPDASIILLSPREALFLRDHRTALILAQSAEQALEMPAADRFATEHIEPQFGRRSSGLQAG
jgi:hypothetical protein